MWRRPQQPQPQQQPRASPHVRGHRQVSVVLEAADDVEVRHAGLDHEDVGALVGVEVGLEQRLAAVGRVLLVRLLVAEPGVRVEGVAERPVVRRRVLGRVRHDAHVREPLRVERRADRADAAVLHVRRRDDVRAGPGLGGKERERERERERGEEGESAEVAYCHGAYICARRTP
jgi:hypothetical protein